MQVNRTNMGLTLDVGHLLMAGENPAQSVAMAGQAGVLFGLQVRRGCTWLMCGGHISAQIDHGVAACCCYRLQAGG